MNTDLNLLAKKAIKDEKAFSTMFYILYPKIYRYAYAKVKHKEDAEDVTTEVFEKLLKKLYSYDMKKSSFLSWIYTMTRNTVIDHIRSNYRYTKNLSLEESEYANMVNEQEKIENKILFNQVVTLIDTFPSKQKELFILRYISHFTNREIAVMISVQEKTVSSVLSRLISELSKKLNSTYK